MLCVPIIRPKTTVSKEKERVICHRKMLTPKWQSSNLCQSPLRYSDCHVPDRYGFQVTMLFHHQRQVSQTSHNSPIQWKINRRREGDVITSLPVNLDFQVSHSTIPPHNMAMAEINYHPKLAKFTDSIPLQFMGESELLPSGSLEIHDILVMVTRRSLSAVSVKKAICLSTFYKETRGEKHRVEYSMYMQMLGLGCASACLIRERLCHNQPLSPFLF